MTPNGIRYKLIPVSACPALAELIHRLIAPVRVPDSQFDRAIDFHLIGFAHRFEAGHSVRLTLASTDQTSSNARLPDTINTVSGGNDPSYFDVPGNW